jgi:hypothetical protein
MTPDAPGRDRDANGQAAAEPTDSAPPDPIEVLFDQLSRLVESLKLTGEPSLAISVSEVASKSLLIAAASRFEAEFSEMFADVASHLAAPAIVEFAINQGVTRKYHTLFDWRSGNANTFYKLLGAAFKERATRLAASDTAFATSVTEFVAIGNDRNELVHSDFASFPLTATLDELVQRYRLARNFLPNVRSLLLEETMPAGAGGPPAVLEDEQ